MATADLPLTVDELESAIAAVDRDVLLAPPRILRRVIKHDRHISTLGLRVPHRKSYLIDAQRLLQIVDRDELGLTSDDNLSGTVLLLARPDAEQLAALTSGEALVKYWRLLFHARIHQELDRRVADGRLDAAVVRQRVARLGAAEFEEIRLVLRQEDMLLPPADDVSVYVEFVAVFCELRFFASVLLKRYFPALDDAEGASRIIEQDIDALHLWTQTRLTGAPLPVQTADDLEADELNEEVDTAEITVPEARASESTYRRLNRRADRAAAVGNAVRAAILRTRAARFVRPSLANRVRAAARDDLRHLTERLRQALKLSDKETWRWSQALIALLSRSVHGFWTREGRTLYDLQKVCVDAEREVYQLDLLGWAWSRGRRPLKRHLPGQREVLMSKHLRVALRRSAKARIDDRERRRLVHLLQAVIEQAETRLRDRFRPIVGSALDEVGLRPANLPERVASKKLVEELLDQILERDFLTMSDLRDAISRNNLKLPDLESGRQFFSGDQLLAADRVLGRSLDGVYHPGEVYLRLPQRLSSLAFGTSLGRVLVRYLAIPYGGAYLSLKFLEHVVMMITGRGTTHAAPSVAGVVAGKLELISSGAMWFGVIVLGTFLLGFLYGAGFRRACLEVCRWLFRAARWLVVDLPAWALRIPLIAAVLASPVYRFAGRFVIKPLVFTVLILAAFRSLAQSRAAALSNGVVLFFLVNLVLNSRLGRNVEEWTTDWVVYQWDRFRLRVLGALLQMVIDFFNRVLDMVDRFLYSVDEWLRFRSGQGQAAVVIKSVLGLAWFCVTYVVRFCITLLIEPQLNPVKHFPVVTVSHKILAPIALTPAVYDLILPQLERVMAPVAAKTLYSLAVFALPGAVGFFVWELKENWRLYKANRSRTLQPAAIGHHGETMIRLLRYGFHSGTISKLQMRLRRADRKAIWTGDWKKSHKYRAALASLDHELRKFIEREFVELLAESRRFDPLGLKLGRVVLGANSVALEILCPQIAESPLRIGFSDQAGWLTGRVIETGWAAHLSDAPRQALADALTGLYKMSGVELVQEQIAANIDPHQTFEITDYGVAVYSAAGQPQSAYQLRDEAVASHESLPVIRPDPFDRESFVFASWPVPWDLWVEVWDRDQNGGRHTPRLVVGAQVLPQSLERAVS